MHNLIPCFAHIDLRYANSFSKSNYAVGNNYKVYMAALYNIVEHCRGTVDTTI